jgi:putative transposase
VFPARHADVVGEEGWPVVAETIPSMSSMKDPKKERSSRVSAAERAAVQELVRAARGRGEDITGPDGLLKSITATVLESALEEEMTDHLGHAKHQAPEGGADNLRNGTRAKTVLTDAAGEVTIEVPRDRAGTFDPVIAQVATTSADRRRLGRDLAVCRGADHRGHLRAFRRGLRRLDQ